jgi:ABC-type Na+ efflux pump permease subunit
LGTIFVRWSQSRTRVDWRRKLLSWLLGGQERRRPRSVWNNPVAWREAATSASAGGRGILRWLFLILGLTAGVLLWIGYAWGWFSNTTIRALLQSVLWVELTIVLLALCNVSASAITREREDGTLDLLLVTPITSRYYLWGKLRGLMSFAAILLIAPVGTAVLFCIQDLLGPAHHYSGGPSAGPLPGVPVVSPAGVLALAATMLSFCALAVIVALNMSLKVRRTISAVMATVAIIGVVGVGGSACALSMSHVEMAGPLVAMVSPYVTIHMVVSTSEFAGRGWSPEYWSQLQPTMLVHSFIACGAFSLVVWGMYNSMVKTFDMIIRRQSH